MATDSFVREITARGVRIRPDAPSNPSTVVVPSLQESDAVPLHHVYDAMPFGDPP